MSVLDSLPRLGALLSFPCIRQECLVSARLECHTSARVGDDTSNERLSPALYLDLYHKLRQQNSVYFNGSTTDSNIV